MNHPIILGSTSWYFGADRDTLGRFGCLYWNVAYFRYPRIVYGNTKRRRESYSTKLRILTKGTP